jgi:hypothetical protein
MLLKLSDVGLIHADIENEAAPTTLLQITLSSDPSNAIDLRPLATTHVGPLVSVPFRPNPLQSRSVKPVGPSPGFHAPTQPRHNSG